jgi:UDP-N-acetylmuramoyl-L-alanyl-D-glutamate--2,6-diaminopimelate ligase
MAATHEMGMPLEDIIRRTGNIPQVGGRMEIINEGQDFLAIVDYAHTPDGYEKIFQFAKEMVGENGRIFAAFGCPGKRDVEKRPVMGEIAGRNSDMIVLTLEDPRDADPAEIAVELAAGVEKAGCPYQVILDREKAIKTLLEAAGPGDVVLVLGKGDEPYMYMEDGRAPWDGDHVVMRRLLKETKQKK